MILGHQKQRQFLKKRIQSGKSSQAYLFSGLEKLGKKTIALELAKSLIGTDISKRQHPDFILVEPLKPSSAKAVGGKGEIKISQIRDLIWRLSLKAYLAPFKIAIIDQSQLMTKDSQNCLLKTLEEPKGKALLILISSDPKRLLPTVLSRVWQIKFFPVKRTEIENYLKKKGMGAKEAAKVSKLSRGRPGIAIDFLLNPKKIEEQNQKIRQLIEIINSDLASRFQYAKKVSAELNLREVLDWWVWYFRDALISTINHQPPALNKYSLFQLKRICELLENTKFLIFNTNINPRLALENLMIEL